MKLVNSFFKASGGLLERGLFMVLSAALSSFVSSLCVLIDFAILAPTSSWFPPAIAIAFDSGVRTVGGCGRGGVCTVLVDEVACSSTGVPGL